MKQTGMIIYRLLLIVESTTQEHKHIEDIIVKFKDTLTFSERHCKQIALSCAIIRDIRDDKQFLNSKIDNLNDKVFEFCRTIGHVF